MLIIGLQYFLYKCIEIFVSTIQSLMHVHTRADVNFGTAFMRFKCIFVSILNFSLFPCKIEKVTAKLFIQ